MKRIIKLFIDFLESASQARAATVLTRMGRWKEAQQLMNK